MFAANADWYKALSDAQRKAFDDACAKTQVESFAQIELARKTSMDIMKSNGCAFHQLTTDEYKLWGRCLRRAAQGVG